MHGETLKFQIHVFERAMGHICYGVSSMNHYAKTVLMWKVKI